MVFVVNKKIRLAKLVKTKNLHLCVMQIVTKPIKKNGMNVTPPSSSYVMLRGISCYDQQNETRHIHDELVPYLQSLPPVTEKHWFLDRYDWYLRLQLSLLISEIKK